MKLIFRLFLLILFVMLLALGGLTYVYVKHIVNQLPVAEISESRGAC